MKKLLILMLTLVMMLAFAVVSYAGTTEEPTTVSNEAVATENDGKVAQIGEAKYETLDGAISSAVAGDTIILLDNVTVNAKLVVDKEITIDLNGKTVTSTAQKAFEIYSNVTIENGTIVSVQRCVDTRVALELTLNDVTLTDNNKTTYGNPQPLTIGGAEHGTIVNLTNVNIDTIGYGIIVFVETELTATNTVIDSFGALYVKKEAPNCTFSFVNSTLISDLTGNDVEGNSFGVVVVCANNTTLDFDSASKLEAKGNHSYAIGLGTQFPDDQKIVKNASITVDGTISGNVIDSDSQESNTVIVPLEYVDAVKEAGFNPVVSEGKCVVVDWTLTDVFGFLGFSVRENGTGFAVGYSFNSSAYKAYNMRNETELEFGTHFAVNGMSPIEASLVDYAKDAGVFNVVVCGLNESHADLNLEMTLYLVDGEGKKYVNYENGEVSYDSTVKNLWNVGEYLMEVNA